MSLALQVYVLDVRQHGVLLRELGRAVRTLVRPLAGVGADVVRQDAIGLGEIKIIFISWFLFRLCRYV